MTDFEVVFDGTPDRPWGRQLFVPEHPPVFPTPDPRTAYTTTRREGTSRRKPVCQGGYCQNRVDAAGDRLCRICKTL